MKLINSFFFAVTVFFIPVFVGFHTASAGCGVDRMNEEFEAHGYEEWESVPDGGSISLGSGYKGQGVVITRTSSGGEQYTRLKKELPPDWAGGKLSK